MVRARDVRAVPEDETFDKAMFLGVRGTPSNPSAATGDDGLLRTVPRAPPVERSSEQVAAPIPRRVILHRSYFEKFGYTEGCQKCRAILRGDDGETSLGHSQACRTRMEALMETDPVLRERVQAARLRRDGYLAEDLEREHGPRSVPSAEAPRGEPSQAQSTSRAAESVPVPDEEEDGVPEIGGDEAEEPEAKRARTGSVSERSGDVETPDAGEPDESEEPAEKRMRTGTISAVLDPKPKKVAWAEMDDSESALEVGGFRRYRCDHCNSCFGSRNELFVHLKAVGRAPTDPTPGSVRGWRPSTEDAAGDAINYEEPLEEPHAKPSKLKRRESVYDVCEVFSPARTAALASKHGLRGGWSLDIAHTCSVTGRRWDGLNAEDKAWCKRMLYRDRPRLLVVSPPCTLFSLLQNLSPNGLPQERCPE